MIAVSDAHGAIHSDAGIDANELHAHISGGGLITEFEGVDEIQPDDLVACRSVIRTVRSRVEPPAP